MKQNTDSQKPAAPLLSFAKTTIYLIITTLGLLCVICGWPGKIFSLIGIGLLMGHVYYRSTDSDAMQPFLIIGGTLLLLFCAILFLSGFLIDRAVMTALLAFALSFLIDRFAKRKESSLQDQNEN